MFESAVDEVLTLVATNDWLSYQRSKFYKQFLEEERLRSESASAVRSELGFDLDSMPTADRPRSISSPRTFPLGIGSGARIPNPNPNLNPPEL